VETAEFLAAPHGLVPQVRDDLREFAFGEWEGLSFSQLEENPEWRRFNAHRSLVRAPGGELMTETQARMVGAIEDLSSRHDGEITAIVSHCDPLRSAIAYYLGAALDLFLRFEISPASVTVVRMYETGPSIRCINQTEHIPL